MENLTYVIDPVKFPMAVYEVVVTDITEGIDDDWKMEPVRLDLRVFDSTPITIT